MEKLGMDYTFTKGKYANKNIEELTHVKGAIFSMIKEGYEFEDDVLAAAHIKKIIRDVKTHLVVNENKPNNMTHSLPVEKASMKQILSELNTLDHIGDNVDENDATEEQMEINMIDDDDNE